MDGVDTNSESNAPLSSEETDDSMNDTDVLEYASESVNQPGVVGQLEDVNVEAIPFPADAFLTLMEGLNKLPTWTVYPKHLAECISATTTIGKTEQGFTQQEANMMRKLIREGLNQAFSKCLDDGAVLGWPLMTQVDILSACVALVGLGAQKLEVLKGCSAVNIPGLEEELSFILAELAAAFDTNCTFHVKNIGEDVPTKLPPVEQWFAEAIPEMAGEVSSVPGSRRSESPESLQLRQYEWLAYLVNYFGALGGFKTICSILADPSAHSISFLDFLLAPLVKAYDLLIPASMAPLAEKLQGLLDFLSAALKEDLEHLSDKGRDRMFSSASSLLERINVLLVKCSGPAEADAAVGKVQRQFIVKLLDQSSFSKHLSAVRETNNLLMRALGLRSLDQGNSIKVNVEWMRENDVVKQLLRANLHQKQYVDQVQKVLKNLTIEGGLQEDHLDLLWNLTEKVDTFETVKNNVYDMLGDLAQDFNNQQLDALFSKFEACSARPVPDAMKIMDLMRRLAKSDTKGVMAKRVMSLLWSMMMNPEAPSEVSKSPAITDALQAYANRKGLVDMGITYEYMRQCIMQIQAGTSVLAAMNLLHKLVNARAHELDWRSGCETLCMLEKDFGAIDVVITSLEDFMVKERQQAGLNDGDHPLLTESAEHVDVVREYANFLLHVPFCGPIEVTWAQVERIWGALVDNAACTNDRIFALHLFQCQANRHILSVGTLNKLLTEKLTGVDVSRLSLASEPHYYWHLFHTCFRLVAIAENKVHEPPSMPDDTNPPVLIVRSLELTGLPTLWRIALDAEEASQIVSNARQTLVAMYTCLDEELQKDAKAVRMQFIGSCLREFLPAARLLTGKVDEQAVWRHHAGPAPKLVTHEQLLAARRAARCLALLQDIVAACQGRTMPAIPMHAASYQGSPARFEVQTTNAKQQPNRFRINCHSHMYIGQMRRSVATKLSASPENVRLFAHGRELINNARLIREESIQDGTTIMAAASPNANNYTLLTPEKTAEMETASPVSLLANSSELYDVLLCLADLCQDISVRQNAMRLLEVMPTDSEIMSQLVTVIASSSPCKGMRRILSGAESPTKPARLLYTMQALNGLLFPVVASEESTASARPEHIFVSSGCISALLEAIKAANYSDADDFMTVRNLHSTALLLLARLQGTIAKAASSDVSMAEAAEPADGDQSMSTQETATSLSEPLAPEADDAPTGAVTVTLDNEALSPKPDGAVLTEMMLFYLNLAIRAARGWRSEPLVKLGPPDVQLPDLDASINQDALASLKLLLEMQPQLQDVLFTSAEHKQALATMLMEGLLNCGHEVVRSNAFRFGERLSKSGNGQGHFHLLEMLHGLEVADASPHFCTEYYRLLTEIIRSIPTTSSQVRAMEIPIAEAMLGNLVAASATMTAVNELDMRLEGKLSLLLDLVSVLDRRHIGTPNGGDLVHRLITEYLFPESWFLFNLEDAPRSLLQVPLPEIAQALKARCITKTCRTAALNLLHDLMSHNSANLRDGMELIRNIHFSVEVIADDKLDYSPRVQARRPSSFVGLRNAGATCYMNSIMQQLFMQPSIRRLILSSPEVPKAERLDSVFYQLQSIFANLALSNKDTYRPYYFWKAFKDYDGEPLNVREHQDAYEFFTRLQDLVDQHMRDRKERPVMQLVMGGKFAQQIICRNQPFRSEKEEDFYQISLDVRGKRNLEESLDFYVQGELMEGDNQYLCEELNQKVDAVKRNCIKVLPHMLVVHLKRFEYDYETMNRWKIKDRFEFPQTLDMYKYTSKGLDERERQEATMAGDASEAPPAASPANPEQYQYYLKGIVVHSGTAFAGHYYSYIKVRNEAGQDPHNAGNWYCFDDNNVDPWDPANIDKDCFGGKFIPEVQETHLSAGPKEYDRPNSAYMLFYERADVLEPVTLMDEMDAAAPREAASIAAGVPVAEVSTQAASQSTQPLEREAGMVSDLEASSSGRDLTTVPIVSIADTVPSIYEEVLESNLKLMQELRLLDRDYFKFLFRLVKDTSEAPFLPPSSMRRTEPSPTLSNTSGGSVKGSPEPPSSTPSARREADIDQAAERVINFAGQFLLRVFLKSSSLLREDQEAWQHVILSILEANTAANRWFLCLCFVDSRGANAMQSPESFNTIDDDMLENYLLWCHLEDVSKFVASLVLQALKNAIKHDNGAVTRKLMIPRPAFEHRSSAWAVHKVVNCLYLLFKKNHVLDPKFYPFYLFVLLRNYAALGPQQREHLNTMCFLKQVLLAFESQTDDRYKLSELATLMEVASYLARSLDFSSHQNAHEQANPYSLDQPHRVKGGKDILTHMQATNNQFTECLLWPHAQMHENVKLLLEFLLWQNQKLSVEWLSRVPGHVRKLSGDQLHSYAPVLVDLVAIKDRWLDDRVKMVLAEQSTAGKDTGLLYQACDQSHQPVAAGKRFAIIKLIVMLVQAAPGVYAALEGLKNWMWMSDWMEKTLTSRHQVSNRQDFQDVDSLLQQMIAGDSFAVDTVEDEPSAAEEGESPKAASE